MSTAPSLQLADRPLTLRLHDVAVDRRRGESTRTQLLGEFLGGLLGADEDDHRLERLDLEDARQGIELALVRDLDVALRDVRGGRGLRLDRDLDGVVQVLLGDLANGRRHRRREQRDLLVLRGVGENPLDVLLEAHLQHLVGLVENQVVEFGEVERALLEVVDHATRRAHDDVGAAAQTRQLRRRSSGHRRSAARALRGRCAAYGRMPRRPAAPVHASARGPTPAVTFLASGRSSTGSVSRTRRSCRCRSAQGRRRRCRRAAAEWSRPGSATATRSRRRRRPAAPKGVSAGRRRSDRRWSHPGRRTSSVVESSARHVADPPCGLPNRRHRFRYGGAT